MPKFIGRKHELEVLRRFLKKKTASLIVVRGRRRIKFSKHPIGYKIIDEMQQKIKKLKRPKGLSCRPVLIHVNGIHHSVVERGYFSDIIDFGQALDGD